MRRGMTSGICEPEAACGMLARGESRMSQARLIGIAGLIAWLMVGVPAFIYHAGTPPSDARWTVAFLAFGAFFAAALRRPRLIFLLAESAAAIALVLLRCNGYEGTLLAIVA